MFCTQRRNPDKIVGKVLSARQSLNISRTVGSKQNQQQDHKTEAMSSGCEHLELTEMIQITRPHYRFPVTAISSAVPFALPTA